MNSLFWVSRDILMGGDELVQAFQTSYTTINFEFNSWNIKELSLFKDSECQVKIYIPSPVVTTLNE